MFYVSLIVEILRVRPGLVVWLAALVQAILWTLVPAVFYAAPPGAVPEALAVGREFQLGTHLGPPFAFWLAEIAFKLGGTLGVYALSQICVVTTYVSIYLLGRAIVGPRHAALAVLLMAGIFAFTLPTPEFGPSIAAMPLWALVLLHYWRAVGEGRRFYWLPLALEMGLLLLTAYQGFVLVGLLFAFTAATARGRASLASLDPWIVVVFVVVIALPHLIWLDGQSDAFLPLPGIDTPARSMITWLWLLSAIVLLHAGVWLLVAVASGWPAHRSEHAPAIQRRVTDPFGKSFIYFFALAPSLTATLASALTGRAASFRDAGVLLLLSGLALIVAAGDSIQLYRQRIAGLAWVLLLLAPPVLAALGMFVLPWTVGADLNTAQPAEDMGRYFAETFQRRTGRPLTIVAGDPRAAALVALGAPSRPSVYLDGAPQLSPWVTPDEIRKKGAVLVWPTTATAGAPPPEIRARFPDLTPELPRAFERRPVQGRLPLVRMGWGVIRPQDSPPLMRQGEARQ
jgi:4-amino-4-deoxy-L-arabinose transferase-like glycosyltransferase